MDVSLGKSLDAWCGRLIDFIAADPLRREVRLKLDAEPAPARLEAPGKAAPEPVAEPQPRAVAKPQPRAVAKPQPRPVAEPKPRASEKKAPEKKAPKKKPAPRPAKPRPTAAALEAAVQRAAEQRAEETPPRRAELAAADRQVLDTLAAFADGAAINELAAATGQTAAALRRRLTALASAGHVERVAAGLRTRFRRTGG